MNLCRVPLLTAVVFLLFCLPAVAEEEGDIWTLWPLLDYRRSAPQEYASLSLLGPLITYERSGDDRQYGVRPIFFHRYQGATRHSDYLYPVASGVAEEDHHFFQVLRLLQYDFGARSEDELMFFPFLFYGETETRGDYFALFPFGGRLYERFGRDEMSFALFPLYGRTVAGGRTTTNILWPIFARIQGEDESGIKVWPLFGASEKDGVYRRRMFLWPIFFRYDQHLDTPNPERIRTVFPLYVGEDSPRRSRYTVLWPFFSYEENRAADYEEWNFPWPLLRVARGGGRDGLRLLPLYADERRGDFRSRWFLWPVYRVEELQTEMLHRRRDRVLFFLYSDLRESWEGAATPAKRRVALWPLFTYEKVQGISRFHTLSLFEPFFPENESIQRSWSPLWRLYQRHWDGEGNEISSLLWNLYWKERRGEDLALEVFPLVRYTRAGESTDLRLLKGLFRYRRGADGGKVNLLWLPWGFNWGGGSEIVPPALGEE